jgi:hypothetical protein
MATFKTVLNTVQNTSLYVSQKEYKRATTKLFEEEGDLLLPMLKRGVF